jgi:tetratricopeptide (TPR) repeat protein/energy-coupling factor transporter ATP-binding protein EcfA2
VVLLNKFSVNNLTPLIGDPERQAIDSLRGYDYQIWRTVETWLGLRDGQMLCIECAEDFDVVSPESAIATQVKNSPANISLNSTDVKEAISNFWRHQERNSSRYRVSMRFLTRGGIAKEQKSDLGNEKGLELWAKAAGGDDEATRSVATHLKKQGGSTSFLKFLENATAEQLKERLFSRITWLTEEPTVEAVVLAVERLAINYGEQRGIAPIVSKRAVSGLLERCREAAIKDDPDLRTLTLQDAQLAFEQNSTLAVPLTQQLAAAVSAIMATGPGWGQGAISFSTGYFDGDLPELPTSCLPREEFLKEMASLAQQQHCVLVVGAEGEGKSTSANMLVRHLGSSSYWMDLRGGDDKISAAAIENALLQVRSPSRPESIVLDDVPVANGISDELWGRLRILIDSSRRSGVMLAMTSKGVPLDQVDPKLKTAGVAIIAVPRITQDETERYFLSLGCPSLVAAETWAKLTLANSGNGHPKLVHLAGLELKELGWDMVHAVGFLTAPRSIEEARANARQTACKTVQLPDRDLLFALSLSFNPFDRALALDLGGQLKIDEPGASFDRLNGRWIERYGRSSYKVTPLLSNQAKELWDAERVKLTHGLLLDSYLRRSVIGVQDALGLFLHALFSEDPRRFLRFVSNLISKVEETPGLAESLELIVSFGQKDDQDAIAFDFSCSFSFRLLQFRVAKSRRPEALPEIARRWRAEIERGPEGLSRTAMLAMRGLSVAGAIDGAFSQAQIVEAVVDAIGLERLGIPIQKLTAAEAYLVDSDKDPDPIQILFSFAQVNSSCAKDVSDFLDALENLEESTRNRLLGTFGLSIVQDAGSVFDRSFVSESKKASPDWLSFANSLDRAVTLSKEWEQWDFGVSAAKVLAIVLNEHLDERGRAEDVLLDLLKRVSSNLLRDQLANIAFRHHEDEKALRLWGECLHGAPGSSQIEKGVRDPFAMRRAGIVADRLGQHDLAAEWFESAARVTSVFFSGIPAVPFRIDAVYCWFQHGNARRALQLAAEVLDEVGGVIDPQQSPHMFVAQKMLGVVMLWFWQEFVGAVGEGGKPFAGVASNPDLDVAAIGKLDPTPRDMCALMIFECATLLSIEEDWLVKLGVIIESTHLPAAEQRYWLLRLQKSLTQGRYTESVNAIYFANEAYLKMRMLYSRQALNLMTFDEEVSAELREQDIQMASLSVVLALALAKMNKVNLNSLVSAWRSALAALPHGAFLANLADELTAYFKVDPKTAIDLVRVSSNDLERIGAAACVLFEDSRNPINTAQAQWVLAYKLLSPGARALLNVPLTTLCTMFTQHWTQHMQTPALLSSPRLSLPQIEAAISAPATPSERLMKLARAGATASGATIPAWLLQRLVEVIGTERPKETLIAKYSMPS